MQRASSLYLSHESFSTKCVPNAYVCRMDVYARKSTDETPARLPCIAGLSPSLPPPPPASSLPPLTQPNTHARTLHSFSRNPCPKPPHPPPLPLSPTHSRSLLPHTHTLVCALAPPPLPGVRSSPLSCSLFLCLPHTTYMCTHTDIDMLKRACVFVPTPPSLRLLVCLRLYFVLLTLSLLARYVHTSCIHTFMYSHIYTYMHSHMYKYVFTYVCIRICIHIQMHIWIYEFTCICIHTYMYPHVYVGR